MSFYSYIRRKLLRFLSSRIVLKFNYFFHLLFGEKNLGNIGFDFSQKHTRKFIVQDIIDKKNYKSYLEIGCFDNELFDHVKCIRKVGIDPYTGGTIRKTSDKFFESNNENFDCIFIDGLHTYNQVKKDIYNSLKFLNPNGIILLHDCLPNNYFEQATPRCQYIWNGDVWKAIVECRTNKDLDTYRTGELCLKAMDLSKKILNKDGIFLSKLFMGSIFEEINKKAKKSFKKVVKYKPLSSRKESKEIYIYCKGISNFS